MPSRQPTAPRSRSPSALSTVAESPSRRASHACLPPKPTIVSGSMPSTLSGTGSVPAVVRAQGRRDAVEPGAIEHGPLAADAVLIDLQDAVEPDPARTVLPVPVARAEREPVALAVPFA